MMRRDQAEIELDALLSHPVVCRRWPEGLTTDDVVEDLHELGRVHIRVGTDTADARAPRFTCAVELREGAAGLAYGRGRTLTAAALRCLLDAEAELDDVVRRGLDALDDFLAAA